MTPLNYKVLRVPTFITFPVWWHPTHPYHKKKLQYVKKEDICLREGSLLAKASNARNTQLHTALPLKFLLL